MANGTRRKAMDTLTDEMIFEKIGDKLKEYRKKKYSNYEEFAFIHGFNRAQYGKYEKGGNMQLDTLIRILRALDISLEEFFKGFK